MDDPRDRTRPWSRTWVRRGAPTPALAAGLLLGACATALLASGTRADRPHRRAECGSRRCAPRSALGWARPRCFAYAPEHDAYACLEMALEADLARERGRLMTRSGLLRPLDLERWARHARPTPSLELRVVLVRGDDAAEALEVASVACSDPDAAASCRPRRARSDCAGRAWAAGRGFTRTGVEEHALEDGRWTTVAGLRLRARSHYREHGGVGGGYRGTVELACATDPTRSPATLALEFRRAVVFHAPGATALALGLFSDGGGEDVWTAGTSYRRLDPASVCATEPAR